MFVSIDVDVLDPAYAPGTGTPEPGGMTSADLLWAAREIGANVELVGADVVEVLPDRIGSRDITALVADRIVRELLTGVAVGRAQRPVMAGSAAPATVPASNSRPISASPSPSTSARISSVCSPSSGARRAGRRPAAVKSSGEAGTR